MGYSNDIDLHYYRIAPDTGCKYAKESGYQGTCLKSPKFPNGCPFLLCLEYLHDEDSMQKEREIRNAKIRELYSQIHNKSKIGRMLNISETTVANVLKGDNFKVNV